MGPRLDTAKVSGTDVIPYRSFPTIDLGPLSLHTFGLATAAGVLLGFGVLQRHGRRHGLDEDELARLGVRLVVAGLLGARLAYVLTRFDHYLGRPLEALAVWDGGLQFFGGLAAGLVVLWRWLRAHTEVPGLLLADGLALALASGMVAGRVGCYAVGEHLGSSTSFPLGIRYLGGTTIEGPLTQGATVHSTALYEALGLLALVALLARLRRGHLPYGAVFAVATTWYGTQRFLTDFLRAYDRRFLGLTVAQLACLALLAAGAWMLARVRSRSRMSPAGAAPCA